MHEGQQTANVNIAKNTVVNNPWNISSNEYLQLDEHFKQVVSPWIIHFNPSNTKLTLNEKIYLDERLETQ